MLWVSLEEAEPIPDISWGIRVLQPPPEQENMEYGELGQGRGRLLQVPQHTASVAIFSASRLTLWGSWDYLQEVFSSSCGWSWE